ncbi:hypothetical protein GEMRC1_013909 [Eukaryota sp. GEM-RC1]
MFLINNLQNSDSDKTYGKRRADVIVFSDYNLNKKSRSHSTQCSNTPGVCRTVVCGFNVYNNYGSPLSLGLPFSLFLPSSIIADLLLAFEMTRVMFFSFFVFDKRTCLSFPLHQVLSLARYPIRLPDPLISKKRPISSASISCCFSSLKKFLLLLPRLCRYSLSQCRSF